MMLGGFMLVLGLIIVALSIYMMAREHASWKWFIGIPDGLFAAYTGFAVLLYARGGRAPEPDAGTLAKMTGPLTSWFRRRRDDGAVGAAEETPAAVSASVEQRDRRRRYPFTTPERTHPLVRRRLDRHGHSYYGTEPRGDGTFVSSQLGLLAHDRDVDVDGRAA
jgi:hypothetical protein